MRLAHGKMLLFLFLMCLFAWLLAQRQPTVIVDGTGEIPMENMWSSRYDKSEDRVWETTGVDSAGYS